MLVQEEVRHPREHQRCRHRRAGGFQRAYRAAGDQNTARFWTTIKQYCFCCGQPKTKPAIIIRKRVDSFYDDSSCVSCVQWALAGKNVSRPRGTNVHVCPNIYIYMCVYVCLVLFAILADLRRAPSYRVSRILSWSSRYHSMQYVENKRRGSSYGFLGPSSIGRHSVRHRAGIHHYTLVMTTEQLCTSFFFP